MIGVNPEHSEMSRVVLEQRHYGDVMILQVNEGYRYLTALTWGTFHQLIPLLENPSCKSAFLVRADTDYVLNYKIMAQTIATMPKTLTYFGSFIPNAPSERLSRQTGSFAQSLMPLWTLGGFYGFSVDVVKQLVSLDVERTILKKEERYVFPEEDRAVSLTLARSNTSIQNLLFTKGTFHFCPLENFTCADYGHFMAFAVGFGSSKGSQNHTIKKRKLLDVINKQRKSCDDNMISPFRASDYYFKVDAKFKREAPSKFVTYGCKGLSDKTEELIGWFDTLYSLALEKEKQLSADAQCAERIYREVHPGVEEYIKNGTFASGREHYLEIGYLNASMPYYCPRVCNHDPNYSTISNKSIL